MRKAVSFQRWRFSQPTQPISPIVHGSARCPGRPKIASSPTCGSERTFGITAEGGYIYGLKDLKIAIITNDESFKTRSFMLLAGIIF